MCKAGQGGKNLWRRLRPVLLAGIALCWGCGHIVRTAPNHPGAPFDFKHPPCPPAARPTEPLPAEGAVDIRYLGAGGLYVRWGDDSILLGPYFSNPGIFSVLFGSWRKDDT